MERGLWRCEELVEEAECRLWFLQGVVAEMWVVSEQAEGEETRGEGEERERLEMEWEGVLPGMCLRS